MSNDIVTGGQEVTFRELFRRHALVEIPLVQRDYAQGRSSEHEVRDEFLEALAGALLREEGDVGPPLNLDFVYGSVEADGRDAFAPLDGQQRLTTLYLLHWYLALRDGALGDFSAFMRHGDHSRFGYAIRPSSREFFDALVTGTPDLRLGADMRLSTLLVEQPWFFRSWQLDPTIQSALSMLDAIHRKFGETSGLYERIVGDERPRITLHLLDLKSFGLSDDLYIKMNARGKPLTPFENFKARMEQHLESMSAGDTYILHDEPATLRQYFSHRIDTVWADVFWHYRDKATNVFDERVMNLVKTLVIVTRNPDAQGSEAMLAALRNSEDPFSFRRFHETGCLDRLFIDVLVAVLDAWSGSPAGIRPVLGPNPYFDELAIFSRAVKDSSGLTYTQLIQFHAYCAFIHGHPDHLKTERFVEWMRVIVNLSENTPYDNVGDLRRAIAGVNALARHAPDIVSHFASGILEVPGFTVQQVREEQLKAQLMLRDAEWRARIVEAERHGYFKGQIEFLLKFCGVLDAWKASASVSWSDEVDAAFRHRFDDYHARATTVLGQEGLLSFGDARWERALLSIGDYLMPIGRNFHFGDQAHRDTSWKRLLRSNASDSGSDAARRIHFRTLLDSIPPGDPDVAGTLDRIIGSTHATGDWREPFVRCPALIEYCKQRMIRFLSPDRIYLLSRKRMSADHVESFTYHLYLTALLPMAGQGLLAPFGKPTYRSVNTDSEEPGIELTGALGDVTAKLSVHAAAGGFTCALAFSGSGDPAPVVGRLASIEGFDQTGGQLTRHVPREAAKTVIGDIAGLLRSVVPAA